MGRFKVGDAVRVKAGSPVFRREPHGCVAPTLECHSEKLVIHSDESGKHNGGSFHREGYYYVTRPNRSVERGITGNYLEPWNDAEEWCETTKRWVAKHAAPKFKVGDKVRIVGPSITGSRLREGEVATVEKCYVAGFTVPCYDVSRSPVRRVEFNYVSYDETSLEAVVEPPAVKAPYIVMLRGKDGRLAPSSHPAEHMDRQEARDEAARLAKRHGQRFGIWQQVAVVEPPAPPKLAAPTLKPGDQVRVVSRKNLWHGLRIGSIATVTSVAYVNVSGVSERDGSVVSQSIHTADFEAVN